MIRSILIPVDGSPISKSVLEVGLNIAKISKAMVKVLYVEDVLKLLQWQPLEMMAAAITTSPNILHGRPTLEQIEIEKEFIKEANCIGKLYEDVFSSSNIERIFLTKRGKVEEIIIDFSKTVDLVIIGKRSAKTYPKSSSEVGPITENLLRHTVRPVIVVPPLHEKLNKNIVIGYDGSKSAERSLSIGAHIAMLMGAKVNVVSVADEVEEADKPLHEAREFLTHYGLDVNYLVDFDSSKPWNAILRQADNFRSCLVVIGAYGENKLLELIFGSTTKEVLKQARCPVLLVR